MTVKSDYALWRAELKGAPHDGDPSQPIAGYWRINAAKTKADHPVIVWYSNQEQGSGDPDSLCLQIGRKLSTDGESGETYQDFITNTFPKCVAVTKEDCDRALETDFWPDGKPARKMTDEERMGIDIAQGDNAAPPDQSLADQIEAAVERAEKIKAITTEAEAKAANELAEKLNALFKLGDAERAKEKAPFDQGAKDVQAKWLPIINPAQDARERLVGRGGLVKAWLKAEQDRIDREAAAERKRIADEAERVRLENAKAAAEAAEQGKPEPAPIAAPDPIPAAEPQRARAGSSFGRATGLRKVVRAEITDIVALLGALSTHKEMVEFAQTLANRAAKAGIPLAGMEIRETME